MSLAQVPMRDEEGPLLGRGYLRTVPRQSTKPAFPRKLGPTTECSFASLKKTLLHLSPQEHVEKNLELMQQSFLHLKPYLPNVCRIKYLLTSLNGQDTPKVYFYDQKMADECANRISIFLNLVKGRTTRGRAGWL